MCDRTNDFHALVQQAPGSSSSGSGGRPLVHAVPKSRTAFHDAAAEIARGVHRTSGVLTKLTKLVRRQGLFDDPTEEINSLIFRIKQDLDELNTKCDSAQQYVDQKKKAMGNANHSAAHNSKVVSQLKTDLMHATKDFKTVLEARSSKMKDQQVRKVELTGNGVLSPMRQFTATSNVKQGGAVGGGDGGRVGSLEAGAGVGVGGGGGGGGGVKQQYYTPYGTDQQQQHHQQQQLLLAPPVTQQYYKTREKAVGEVESTIGELGQLFKRLATMIQEQQELVERIDDDIESARGNADAAHSLLMKTYESVSSNKGLYMKIMAIVGLFGVFFTLFLL